MISVTAKAGEETLIAAAKLASCTSLKTDFTMMHSQIGYKRVAC